MLAGFGKAIPGCCKTAAGCTAPTRDTSPAGDSGSFEPSCRSPGEKQQRKPENQAQGLTLRGLQRGCLPPGTPREQRRPQGLQAAAGQRPKAAHPRQAMPTASQCGGRIPPQGTQFIKYFPQGKMISWLGTVHGLHLVPHSCQEWWGH